MARMIVTVNKLNKRSAPVINTGDKSNIIGTANRGFAFESVNMSTNVLGDWYEDRDGSFYWGVGVKPDAEIVTVAAAAGTTLAGSTVVTTTSVVVHPSLLLKPPAVVPHDMPLSRLQCIRCTTWMKANLEDIIEAAVEGTPFDKELIYAITCQETAQRWQLWIDLYDAATILEMCVFDASGDFPDTSRDAFPKNKNEMLAAYGAELTQMLVNEGTKMRAMPQPGHPGGFPAAGYLYKGYGIFQYDLQHIKEDKSFFADKLWYSADECVARLLKELNTKWNSHINNMYATVRAYNGGGLRAEQYAQRVSQFYTWIKAIQ